MGLSFLVYEFVFLWLWLENLFFGLIILSDWSYLNALVCCRTDAILLTYSYLRVLVC